MLLNLQPAPGWSYGFGSNPQQLLTPSWTRDTYGSPKRLTAPAKLMRWPIIQRYAVTPRRCSYCLYVRFQVLFHSPHRGFFSHPHGTLVHYRSVHCCLWRMVYSDRISRVPPYSISLIMMCRLRGYHPLLRDFQTLPAIIKSLGAEIRSLAATFGIWVDFSSSGYQMFQFPPVCLLLLCIHSRIRAMRGFSHFRNPRLKSYYYLIWAYHRLLRLSSPPTSKASTVYA